MDRQIDRSIDGWIYISGTKAAERALRPLAERSRTVTEGT